jgi:hypothetical protein
MPTELLQRKKQIEQQYAVLRADLEGALIAPAQARVNRAVLR